MPILFSVNVNPEQSEIIQLVAFSNGYSWYSGVKTPKYTSKEVLSFWDDGSITFDDKGGPEPRIWPKSGRNDLTVSFIDAVNILLGNLPIPEIYKTLTIGNYEIIIFPEEKIIFGCTTIGKDVVEEIISTFNKESHKRIRVRVNPGSSEVLQLIAFRHGYSWRSGSKNVKDLSSPRLFFNSKCKEITQSIYKEGENNPVEESTPVGLETAINYIIDDVELEPEYISILNNKIAVYPQKKIVFDNCIILKKDIDEIIKLYRT